MLPTSAQIVAARALLLMEQRTLAKLADVHVATLVRIEAAGWKVVPAMPRPSIASSRSLNVRASNSSKTAFA